MARQERSRSRKEDERAAHARRFSTQGESLYAVLKVEKGVSADELRAAYRRLALRYHPDKNPGDETSADRFMEVSNAFTVLRDPEKRQLYDEYGSLGLQLANQFGTEWVKKYMKKGKAAKTKFLLVFFGILSCGYCFCCCCMFCCGRCKPGVSQDDVDYQENVLRRELNEERNRYLAKERERQKQMGFANQTYASSTPATPQRTKKRSTAAKPTTNGSENQAERKYSTENNNEVFTISAEAAANVVPGAPIDPSSAFGVAYTQRVAAQRRQSRTEVTSVASQSSNSTAVVLRRSSTGSLAQTIPRSASTSTRMSHQSNDGGASTRAHAASRH